MYKPLCSLHVHSITRGLLTSRSVVIPGRWVFTARFAQCTVRPNRRISSKRARSVMELAGLEPATSWVRSRRSPN